MRVGEVRIARNRFKRVRVACGISGRFGMRIDEKAVIVRRRERMEVIPIMVIHCPLDSSTRHLHLRHAAGSLAVATRRVGGSRERRWHVHPWHLHIAIKGEGSQRVDGDLNVLVCASRVLRSYYSRQSLCRAWKHGNVAHVSSCDDLVALAALIHRRPRRNQITDREETTVGAAGRYGDHPPVRGRLDAIKTEVALRVGSHGSQDLRIAESAFQSDNRFSGYRSAGHSIDHRSGNGTRRSAPVSGAASASRAAAPGS